MWQLLFKRIHLLLLPVFALTRDGALSKPVTHIVQNLSDLGVVLKSLPKECKVNGKVYEEGEEFVIGNLRYKCQKYGIHSAEGCITEDKEKLAIGQVLVKDNVKSLCLAVGGKIFYKEATCSVPGSPDCKDVGPPKEYEDACKAALSSAQHQLKEASVPGLPPGWKVIDETQQAIPGMENRVISRTIMFIPLPTKSRRVRRQDDNLSFNARGLKGNNPSANVRLGGGKLTNALGGLVNSKSTQQAVGGLAKSTQQAIGGLTKTAQKTLGGLANPKSPMGSLLNTKKPTQQRPRNKNTHRRISNRRKGHSGNRNFGNSRPSTNRPQRKPDIVRASLPHGQQQDFTFSVNGRSLSRKPDSLTIASSPTGFTVRDGETSNI